jgi:predicted RNA binding protein YcfA (HicA-like mRNA interferase family)
MNKRQLLGRINASPNNVRFADLVTFIEALGYRLDRVAGSHHIYFHPDVPEPLNLQPDGSKAKPYQVRQVIKALKEYGLTLGGDE